MAKTLRLPKEEPLLNIASYARGGPGAVNRLTPEQVEQIRRTVNRAPEAVVKVLPRSSNDLKAVGKHLDYIGRQGRLALESDDGQQLHGRIGKELLEDWDLDIDDVRRQGSLAAADGRKPPKLVHKLMFSMPPGTPPQKVLAAVRNLAREEFYGQHRYALVLHTDAPHPHVHLVLKAVSEQGERLNIKKATLRHWRSKFAHHLRGLGVAANATERAVRGTPKLSWRDGIYRAAQRGDSTYVRAQTEAVAAELLRGKLRVEQGKATLINTRKRIESGWRAAVDILVSQGSAQLAEQVQRFLGQLPTPQIEKEQLAVALLERDREARRREAATR
jgi:hypothetical protein